MSGVLIELARRQNTMVWLFEIDGLQDTYYSSPAAPTLPPYAQPWVHLPQPGIIGVTAADESLDVLGSIVQSGQVAVTIATTRTNDAAQLLKAGRSGAGRMVTLKTTLDQTGAVLVIVNEDISAWAAAGIIWIGREAIRYTARSVAAPYQFTIADADRGWFGSEQRKHVANVNSGWAPRIYDACVTWQGRKARVLVSSLRPDGSQATGWVEYVTGRIVSNPEISGDGLKVAVNIQPHTTALDMEVGGGLLRTGLQDGYHVFDGHNGGIFTFSAGFDVGNGARSTVGPAGSAIGAAVPMAWTDFDKNYADPAIAGATQARAGMFTLESEAGVTFQQAAPRVGPAWNGTIATIPPTTIATVGGQSVANVRMMDQKSVNVLTTPGTAEAIQWPDQVCQTISTALSPGTIDGSAGSFVDLAINPAQQTVAVRPNSRDYPDIQFVPFKQSAPDRLTYGISMWGPEDTRIPGVNTNGAAEGSGLGQDAYLDVPIRGIPSAYYQQGERYLYVQDEITAVPANLKVTWSDFDGTEASRYIRVTSSALASTITVGAPGYILEVDRTTPNFIALDTSFGNWPGESPAVIEQLVAWYETDPGTIILDLLLSGDGTGFSGAYDVLPSGASLTTAEVDRQSFIRYPYPDGLARTLTLSLNSWDSITIEAIIDPILKAIGAAIVLRLAQVADAGDGGVLRRKLSLVPLGSEYGGDSVHTVANGDWFENSRPSQSVDDRIVNALRLAMNYRQQDDDHELMVLLSDRDSIGEYGAGSVEELDLRGVWIDASSVNDQVLQLLPFTAQRWASIGAPRRQIEGTIAWADAVLLNAGATVIVSAVDIYGYDGARGISAQPMRIVSINGDGYMQTARVKLTWHDSTVSGWAPSLKVAAVTNPSTYTVEANIYTELADPITSQPLEDVDYWQAGDSIRACPLGDYGASTGGLTVLSIVGNVVTLSAPAVPALVVGDTLRPDVYTAAATTTAQQSYAYLGDDAGGLGVTPDPAKLYA